MTKQQLAERYKVIEIKQITDDILEVSLWKDKTHPFEQSVKIIFAYDKLYYTGDFGTFVFGKYVHSIKTFFQGDEIYPCYWMEECEASSEPLLDEHIDLDQCQQNVSAYLYEYLYENLDEDDLDKEENMQREIEDTFYNLEDNYIYAANGIADLFRKFEIDNYKADGDARIIVHNCRRYSEYYLYACETIQWVENNLEKWLSEKQESRKSDETFFIDDIDLTDTLKNDEEVKAVLSGKTRSLEETKCQS